MQPEVSFPKQEKYSEPGSIISKTEHNCSVLEVMLPIPEQNFRVQSSFVLFWE
jgi:hypothetical protein